MYRLSFISESDFEQHILKTIAEYNDSLNSYSLAKFNSNIIDPVKLLFDKTVYRKNFTDAIDFEVLRQRDKTNSNSIGYFHQNIFSYIEGCTIPETGFDIIFSTQAERKIYVELKNKHNTMNSSSAQKTYMKMQNQLLNTPNDECYLVEVISKKSRNDEWLCSIDGGAIFDNRIRRVSIDQFYKIVTGIDDAFYQICMQLPETLEKLVGSQTLTLAGDDTVKSELNELNKDTLLALYQLAFESYEGF